MIDIVIPLGNGSRFNDVELIYALRSVDKHLSGVRDVWIIGQLPRWGASNIKHFPLDDIQAPAYKEWNIFQKVKTACMIDQISDDFLFMNDDHYLLHDFEAKHFPYHYKKPLIETVQSRRSIEGYWITLKNTLDLLGEHVMNFDTHCPIMYNKEKFLNAFEGLAWPDFGYGIKTTYCEHNGIKGEYYKDLKTDNPANVTPDRLYFSSNRGSLDLFRFLEKTFPNQSKYENGKSTHYRIIQRLRR